MVSNYTLEDVTIKNIINDASVNVADVQNFYITKVDGTTTTVSFDLGKSIKDNVDPTFDGFAHNMYEADGTITQANKDKFLDTFVKGLQAGFDANMSPSTKIGGYFDSNNKMVFTFEDFSNITMACNTASSQSFGHGFLHSMFNSSSFQQNTTTTTTTIAEYDKRHLYIQAGANSNEIVDFEWDVLDSKVMKINDLKLKSLTEAQKAIDQCDKATNYVLNIRSTMGAYTNRLEHGIKNVDTSSRNLSSSESEIRDADMAKEMIEMSKNSILEQVAQSLLSQANQLPNKVLELLR
ncbi:hypothetical protein JK634_01960 [Clostridium sp. YIM B02565]|uniref:Flagellin C-terminal domain-containing protein n=2 Tax=Clostridium paridis TaxID=2803863 RepID=A0A937FC50_9CLOT|nr:hypothetical protein [Clostridium paridis]